MSTLQILGERYIQFFKGVIMKWYNYMMLFLMWSLLLVGAVVWTQMEYGRKELRRFNRINDTEYSLDEWTCYRSEIRRLHPYQPLKN